MPDIGKAEIAAGATTAGSVIEASSNGLSRAAAAAGDVLRGIVGGLPWQMGPGGIVDAVTNALPDVVPFATAYLPEVLP